MKKSLILLLTFLAISSNSFSAHENPKTEAFIKNTDSQVDENKKTSKKMELVKTYFQILGSAYFGYRFLRIAFKDIKSLAFYFDEPFLDKLFSLTSKDPRQEAYEIYEIKYNYFAGLSSAIFSYVLGKLGFKKYNTLTSEEKTKIKILTSLSIFSLIAFDLAMNRPEKLIPNDPRENKK